MWMGKISHLFSWLWYANCKPCINFVFNHCQLIRMVCIEFSQHYVRWIPPTHLPWGCDIWWFVSSKSMFYHCFLYNTVWYWAWVWVDLTAIPYHKRWICSIHQNVYLAKWLFPAPQSHQPVHRDLTLLAESGLSLLPVIPHCQYWKIDWEWNTKSEHREIEIEGWYLVIENRTLQYHWHISIAYNNQGSTVPW